MKYLAEIVSAAVDAAAIVAWIRGFSLQLSIDKLEAEVKKLKSGSK